MRFPFLALAAALAFPACSSSAPSEAPASSSDEALKVPAALTAADFTAPLDKARIRALQTWLDDAAFEVKWASMLKTPIDFFGGSDSAFHADLATVPHKRLPGGEALCHGDPKLDNFGWTIADGQGVFSDNDFDDAGFCPAAVDALRYLVATDLWFGDATLDAAALNAYVATVAHPESAVTVDPTTEPVWADVRAKGLAKDTRGDAIVLGGEVQAATADEVAAVRALAASDPRFPRTVLDVTRDVRTDGGSAGFRRFWLLTVDDAGVRTILELKETGFYGTSFGRQTQTLDDDRRFDVLKRFWWGTPDEGDHFGVDFSGARFLLRDRLTRANPKPDKMTPAQITNMVQAEASLLALAHRDAWGHVKGDKLSAWLQASAATVTARWRATYAAAGGK
jgi:Uncharacterized protein conserved in bacteria (DUF2252)